MDSIFSIKLKHLRNQKGLTQEELARSLQVSKFSVSLWERSEQFPRPQMLQRIADFFGIKTEDLLENAADIEIEGLRYQWNERYARVAELSADKQLILLKVVDAFLNTGVQQS